MASSSRCTRHCKPTSACIAPGNHYPEVEQRLRDTYAIVQMLLDVDAPRTIKAWFIGMNPELDDVSPAQAIRDGDAREAMGAARAYIVNG